jgi:hypothetical protein
MIHLIIAATLRRLYGNDLIDRLEAAPELGTARDAVAFGDVLDALADILGTRELTVEPDPVEQERFDAECARDLRGDLDE